MSEGDRSDVDLRDYVVYATDNAEAATLNASETTEIPGVEVKFEVEDPEYEQSLGNSNVTEGLVRSFQTVQPIIASQSAADWTGTASAVRTHLRKALDSPELGADNAGSPSSVMSAHNVNEVIEDLLRRNENVLAKNNAIGYRPHSRRGRPPSDGSRSTGLPAPGQSVTFSAGQQTHARIVKSKRTSQLSDKGVPPSHMGMLMRPKSPTRRCSIPDRERSHFNLALMQSQVGCEESEEIFRVQEHEMVCAIASQTKFLNKSMQLVSNVDIDYYWCNFCSFSTTNKAILMQHVMDHRFHCKHCRYQSFSRADVIHHAVHTHPTFQDTAAISQYCTLLSDYLRIQNPKVALLDNRRKRKDPPADDYDGVEEKPLKVSRNGPDKKPQRRYSADYDMFDVTLVDKMDDGDSGSKPSSASSSGTAISSAGESSPAQPPTLTSLVTQPGVSSTDTTQPIITQVFSASTIPQELLPDAPKLATAQAVVPSPTIVSPPSSTAPSPSPTFPNSVGAGAMQQLRSTLYWSCGYCKFTSFTQSGIKEHSVSAHSGKPHRYVALLNHEDRATPPPSTVSNGGESKEEANQESTASRDSTQSEASSMSQSDPPAKSDEPPPVVKQEPVEVEDPSAPIRVRFPTPRVQSKEAVLLKCFHCEYSTRKLGPLRNHILNRHRNRCLVGTAGLSSKVYMCARIDCTFRSSSPHTYLSHSSECTPWLGEDAFDAPPEGYIKRCLEATIFVAEEAISQGPSSSMEVTSPTKATMHVAEEAIDQGPSSSMEVATPPTQVVSMGGADDR